MRSIPLATAAAAAALVTGAGACANDPVYLPGAMMLEAGQVGQDGMRAVATARHLLPIRLEKPEEAMRRAERTAALGGIEVPYVRLGDLEVSVEWTIRNLDAMNPGTALVQLNGANEVLAYDPTMVQLGDEDEPPPPGLAGDIPLHVAPGGTITGLFREDQLREASIDLDQITRANLNPFAATLQVHKNSAFFQPMTPLMPGVEDYVQTPVGEPIPREAFRQIIRVDLVFKPDRPMVMEYTIRVRDTRGLLHDLLEAAPAAELTVFNITDFAVTYTP
jgi:hypothetical protein